MNKEKVRPSPSQSATDFDVNTVLLGNDGDIYMNVDDKNKRLSWKKIANIKNKSIYFSAKILYDRIPKYKLLYCGILDVKGHLMYGDSVGYLPKGFNAGKYYIYYIGSALIASLKKLTDSTFKKTILNNKSRMISTCDMGTHVFRDSNNISLLIKCENLMMKKMLINKNQANKISKMKDFERYQKFEWNIYLSKYKKMKNNVLIINSDEADYMKFGILSKYIKKDDHKYVREIMEENYNDKIGDIFAIMADNKYGDGVFDVLTDDKNSIIMICGNDELVVYHDMINVPGIF